MAEQLIYDYRRAPLSREDRALCDFAAKLTLQPGMMEKQDLDLLSRCGFSDEQITVATQVVAYFNYINRIAEGLGVDPEDWMKPTPSEWRRKKARYMGARRDY